MTSPPSPTDEILKLVEYVEENFPNGCRDFISCSKCPLYDFDHSSTKSDICEMLSMIEYRTRL